MNKKKLIVIINGKGGCGKDTAVDAICKEYSEVMNVSSIDPIKEKAKAFGWDGSKDDKDRKFLADLKQLDADYNDTVTDYLYDQTYFFRVSAMDIMFVHIREPENIEKYIKSIGGPVFNESDYNTGIITLLITRPCTDEHSYGNTSDDNVEDYEYDFKFENHYSTEDEFKEKFVNWFKNIIDPVYLGIK